MSSAIKVLKKELSERKGNLFLLKGEIPKKDWEELKLLKDALGEALLALEQKEETIEWAKKELIFWTKRKNEYNNKILFEDYMEDLALQRIITYEDVLLHLGLNEKEVRGVLKNE